MKKLALILLAVATCHFPAPVQAQPSSIGSLNDAGTAASNDAFGFFQWSSPSTYTLKRLTFSELKTSLSIPTGTVTTITITNANGITGSVSNDPSAPAITLGTALSGILIGNGTGFAVATIGSGLNYNGGTHTLSATGGSGVTSLGGATGVLTLGAGLTIPGNVLTLPQPLGAGDSPTFAAVEVGSFIQVATTIVIGPFDTSINRVAPGIVGFPQGVIQLSNTTTPTVHSGGANIYAKAVTGNSQMFVQNSLGTETQISPHSMTAPAWFYDWMGMDRVPVVSNPYWPGGFVLWENDSRAKAIAAARDNGDSLAKWSWYQLQTKYSESFAQYNARLALDPTVPGSGALLTRDWPTDEAAKAAASDAARAKWVTDQAAAIAAGQPFTAPQPAIYTAQPLPTFLVPPQ